MTELSENFGVSPRSEQKRKSEETEESPQRRSEGFHQIQRRQFYRDDYDARKIAREKYEFFFGCKSPFSQHHPAEFCVDNKTYNCCEQYYMYNKAVTFNDMDIAEQVMNSSDPKEQKRLGKLVCNLDYATWMKHSKDIVMRGNLAKFGQNDDLKKELFLTYPKILVEASPSDSTWGIALSENNPMAWDRQSWQGQNFLGFIITKVRNTLMKEEGLTVEECEEVEVGLKAEFAGQEKPWEILNRSFGRDNTNCRRPLRHRLFRERDNGSGIKSRLGKRRWNYRTRDVEDDREEEEDGKRLKIDPQNVKESCSLSYGRNETESTESKGSRNLTTRIDWKGESLGPDRHKRRKDRSKDRSESSEEEMVNGKDKFVFFFGWQSPFSQHHPCQFVEDDKTFNCAEQFYMYNKAVLFKDRYHEEKILNSKDPKEQKRFGKQIKNFDRNIWMKHSIDVVTRGNMAKFGQNDNLKKKLFATHPRLLVEASPADNIWGIGLTRDDPQAWDQRSWRGSNLLGYVITKVRDQLMADEGLLDRNQSPWSKQLSKIGAKWGNYSRKSSWARDWERLRTERKSRFRSAGRYSVGGGENRRPERDVERRHSIPSTHGNRFNDWNRFNRTSESVYKQDDNLERERHRSRSPRRRVHACYKDSDSNYDLHRTKDRRRKSLNVSAGGKDSPSDSDRSRQKKRPKKLKRVSSSDEVCGSDKDKNRQRKLLNVSAGGKAGPSDSDRSRQKKRSKKLKRVSSSDEVCDSDKDKNRQRKLLNVSAGDKAGPSDSDRSRQKKRLKKLKCVSSSDEVCDSDKDKYRQRKPLNASAVGKDSPSDSDQSRRKKGKKIPKQVYSSDEVYDKDKNGQRKPLSMSFINKDSDSDCHRTKKQRKRARTTSDSDEDSVRDGAKRRRSPVNVSRTHKDSDREHANTSSSVSGTDDSENDEKKKNVKKFMCRSGVSKNKGNSASRMRGDSIKKKEKTKSKKELSQDKKNTNIRNSDSEHKASNKRHNVFEGVSIHSSDDTEDSSSSSSDSSSSDVDSEDDVTMQRSARWSERSEAEYPHVASSEGKHKRHIWDHSNENKSIASDRDTLEDRGLSVGSTPTGDLSLLDDSNVGSENQSKVLDHFCDDSSDEDQDYPMKTVKSEIHVVRLEQRASFTDRSEELNDGVEGEYKARKIAYASSEEDEKKSGEESGDKTCFRRILREVSTSKALDSEVEVKTSGQKNKNSEKITASRGYGENIELKVCEMSGEDRSRNSPQKETSEEEDDVFVSRSDTVTEKHIRDEKKDVKEKMCSNRNKKKEKKKSKNKKKNSKRGKN